MQRTIALTAGFTLLAVAGPGLASPSTVPVADDRQAQADAGVVALDEYLSGLGLEADVADDDSEVEPSLLGVEPGDGDDVNVCLEGLFAELGPEGELFGEIARADSPRYQPAGTVDDEDDPLGGLFEFVADGGVAIVDAGEVEHVERIPGALADPAIADCLQSLSEELGGAEADGALTVVQVDDLGVGDSSASLYLELGGFDDDGTDESAGSPMKLTQTIAVAQQGDALAIVRIADGDDEDAVAVEPAAALEALLSGVETDPQN